MPHAVEVDLWSCGAPAVGAAAGLADFAGGGFDPPRVDELEDGGAVEDGLEVVVDWGDVDEDRTGRSSFGYIEHWARGDRDKVRGLAEKGGQGCAQHRRRPPAREDAS